MRLELGGGSRVAAGWTSVDLNPANQPDYVADVRCLPFDDGTVSIMRAIDVLEHVSYRETGATLREWARVMEPAGILFVQVPDAHEIMRRYIMQEAHALETPDDLPPTLLAGATWRLLGGHADGKYVGNGEDFRLNAHYALFSAASLAEALDAAGFDVLEMETNAHPNLMCKAARR